MPFYTITLLLRKNKAVQIHYIKVHLKLPELKKNAKYAAENKIKEAFHATKFIHRRLKYPLRQCLSGS